MDSEVSTDGAWGSAKDGGSEVWLIGLELVRVDGTELAAGWWHGGASMVFSGAGSNGEAVALVRCLVDRSDCIIVYS